MMICQNVTELRTTQRNLQARLDELTALHARLSELEQLKTDMLKLGAHDLRSPLMVIMNYTQYLAEDLSEIGSPEQIDYINEIRGAAERMKVISHDILDAGRIEHLLDRTALDPVELVGTLRAAAEGLQANAAIKHHTMTICVPENAVRGRGDGPLLREAAVNLIGNAIQYTPEGGRIDVVVSATGGGVEFTVTDTGYGVPPDTRDKLFQPLARAGSKEARREAGTGFGLYLVKRIVERHGGKVFFRSGRIQGSTFGFWLPAERA
jgi:signal transduction histidine kinase